MNTYMEIENLFRSTALAVGLKPSASQGEARLRGLERIIYSKTIPGAKKLTRDIYDRIIQMCENERCTYSRCRNPRYTRT